MPAVAVIILQKADRISALLEERVGVKAGTSLEAGLRHASRHLPYDARAAGRRLAAAGQLARRSAGIVDVDAHRFDDDYRVLLRHLQAIEPGRVRPGQSVWRFVTGVATAVASVVVLGVGLAYAGLI